MTSDQTTSVALRKMEPTEIEAAVKRLPAMIAGFGDISRAQAKLAVQLLDAGFHESHFNIVHGNLFMNMDGRSFWAARAYGATWGGVTHRIMTEDERKGYQLKDNEVGVVATAYKLVPGIGKIEIATDIGRAGGTRDQSQPVAKANPAEMAVKRARARCLRAAAPLGVDMGTVDGGMVVEASVDNMPVEARTMLGEGSTHEEPDLVELDWDMEPVAEPEPEIEAEFRETTYSFEPSDEAEEPEVVAVAPGLDLANPASQPRLPEQVAQYREVLAATVRSEIKAGTLRNVWVFRFAWGGTTGIKAADIAMKEGYSAPQIVELVKLQERSRDEGGKKNTAGK